MAVESKKKIRRTNQKNLFIFNGIRINKVPDQSPAEDKTVPLSQWRGPFPKVSGKLAVSLILPVPLHPYAALDIQETRQYIASLQKLMGKLFPRDHEILFVPFGQKQTTHGSLLSHLTLATEGEKNYRWISGNHSGPGSAIREAVFLSQGRKILVGSLEYLYDPSFFPEALKRLRPHVTGVRANRRLPDSEFIVPTTVLSMVFRRHLLGLALSHIWSRLFSLHLTDFLSGAYVLRREFALRAFSRINCPGFLDEAELEITAQTNGYSILDIPARFFLEKEKPRLRVWGEILIVLTWSWRLWKAVRQKDYAFSEQEQSLLCADDWGLSPGVNEGILALAQQGLLRRVSVLAGGRYLNYRLAELKKINGVEFGLHFNLTQIESGGIFKSPGRFLAAWLFRKRRGGVVQEVRGALLGQLSILRKNGIRPLRLDGHHHVHAVPGLLEEITDILRKEKIRFVRVPYHPSLWFGRRAPIAWLGQSLRKTVRRLGFDTLPFYYPFPRDFSNLNRLAAALRQNPGVEILIHPAAKDDIAQAAPSDSYRKERVREFNLLRFLTLSYRTPRGKNQSG